MEDKKWLTKEYVIDVGKILEKEYKAKIMNYILQKKGTQHTDMIIVCTCVMNAWKSLMILCKISKLKMPLIDFIYKNIELIFGIFGIVVIVGCIIMGVYFLK